MALVPVAEDAKTKRYYKYYEQGIASPTPEQLAAIDASKGTVETCLDIEDRNKVLEPEKLYPEKTGFYPIVAKAAWRSGYGRIHFETDDGFRKRS